MKKYTDITKKNELILKNWIHYYSSTRGALNHNIDKFWSTLALLDAIKEVKKWLEEKWGESAKEERCRNKYGVSIETIIKNDTGKRTKPIKIFL